MATKLSILLFAASATAQITTSFWLPNIYLGTDHITYMASAIGADKDRLTLAIHPANDTDYTALGLATKVTETYTFASTMFDYSTSALGRVAGASSGDYAYSLRCEKQTSDASAACTVSTGPELARGRCNTHSIKGQTTTLLWTFSDPGTQGVETIVRTIDGSPTTPVPDFCSAGTEAPIPSSALKNDGYSLANSDLGTYKFIITAGQEKINATAGGSVSTSTAEPTGSQAQTSSGGTAQATEGTGAAAPMKTVAPALAGLGAAIAVFI